MEPAVSSRSTVLPPPEAFEEPSSTWEEFNRRRRVFFARIRGNFDLWIGGGLLGAYILVGIAALAVYGTSVTTLVTSFELARPPPVGPSPGHPLGVMSGVGVDTFDALFQATPIDLALVLGPIVLAATIGVLVGAHSGLQRGSRDIALTSAADVFAGVPPFFLVLVLYLGVVAFFPPEQSLVVFALLLIVVLWPYYARPVRARAQQVSSEPFVESARAAGALPRRLLFRHVIPNSYYPVLAQAPVDVFTIFFVLTLFPYLNCTSAIFGELTPFPTLPYPEWGFLLAQGSCYGWSAVASANFWWMYTFPALTILVFGIALALACDGATRLAGRVRSL